MSLRLVKTCSFPGILLVYIIVLTVILTSCNFRKHDEKEEQISINGSESENNTDSTLNSIQGNISFNQIASRPNSVILTGMPDHRLVTVYKIKDEDKSERERADYSGYSYGYNEYEGEGEEHYMPGIDILYGYNLLNIAHYNLNSEKLNFLFNHPVLIKTVYYPSFVQDSINKRPINRDYYLVSVYDEDTNLDSLINNRDLRRFYHFDADNITKTQLVPEGYSVMSSQYDSQNDVMYLFARHDENKNGTGDIKEPVHIFWINLKSPLQAKRLY